MKKVAIIVGTRPNFIKITRFHEVIAEMAAPFELRIVHTGQHYDFNMSEIFFQELEIKKPDVQLEINHKDPSGLIGEIIIKLGVFFREWRPDLVIVPGDVNSTLAAAIAAQKEGIKIAHLESGLRSGDRSMPEEINRILTDAITDIFFITEKSGTQNLLKEYGERGNKVFVGNTMIDTLVKFDPMIDKSTILSNLNLNIHKYILATIHRPLNVDVAENLEIIGKIFESIASKIPVVFPVHPRTRKNIIDYRLEKYFVSSNIKMIDPLGYFDFQNLVKGAKGVLTDSGGIQEETTFRQIPCITLRPNTERPITTEIGTNELISLEHDLVLNALEKVLTNKWKIGEIPENWDGHSTERIVSWLSKNF